MTYVSDKLHDSWHRKPTHPFQSHSCYHLDEHDLNSHLALLLGSKVLYE
jgi:hypothetical protein